MSAYTKAVEHYLEGITHVGIGEDDPFFSWSQCDGCGSSLGGDRTESTGIDEDGESISLDLCIDCVMYLANGDEPENWEGES